jgi:hypothetical protein
MSLFFKPIYEIKGEKLGGKGEKLGGKGEKLGGKGEKLGKAAVRNSARKISPFKLSAFF